LSQTIGSIVFLSPLFEEKVPTQTIPEGYEVIGVSVSIQDGKFWPNFLLWPTA
jgi:hypothetical protein